MTLAHKDNSPESNGSMLVVAVTGGICDGKTTVLKMFEEFGAKTLSADAVAQELLCPGTDLWEKVHREFASELRVFERGLLADLIANNPQARRRLNRLMHPPIVAAINKEIEQVRSTSRGIFVVEAPLLIEIGIQGQYDRILVASAGYTIQLERLTQRLGDRDKAALYLQSQLPTSVKTAFADWIVDTSYPLDVVRSEVLNIWTELSYSLRVGLIDYSA